MVIYNITRNQIWVKRRYKTHSSNVAYSLILESFNLIPELLTLRLVVTEKEVEFISSIEDFSSRYHAQITDEEVNKLLQMLLDKETDLQVPKGGIIF